MSAARRLSLLGPVSLSPSGEGAVAQPWRLGLLAYLALCGPAGATRETLIRVFWPATPSDRARHSLSNAIYALRRELGQDAISVAGQTVRLARTHVEVDVRDFEQAIAEGAWHRAVELYKGPFMDGFSPRGSRELQRWIHGRRYEIERVYCTTLEHLASSAAAGVDQVSAVGWWRMRAAHDPLNSAFAADYVRALAAAGLVDEATAHTKEHAERLRAKTGVDAGPVVESLMSGLVAQAGGGDTGASDHQTLEIADQSSPPQGSTVRRASPATPASWRLRGLGAWGVGALAAVTLLVVFTAQPLEPDPLLVVLSDFTEDAGDPRLAIAVTEAMRTELSKAERLELLAPDRVRSRLRLIRGGVDGRLPKDVAREIAVSEGARAVIESDLHVVGEGYLLIARLIAPETGALLFNAVYGESARDSSQLPRAVDRLALSIRRGAGDQVAGLDPSEPLVMSTRGGTAAAASTLDSPDGH